MWNVRGTSTAMPNWLAHGATYALRVYAMRADWDGLTHSNQNVTPHSAIVTFTLPSCNPPEIATTTTTTVALTCATGGTCVVGDTGPGGGIVFYVHSGGGTFSCGVALVSTCRYLEVAPADIAGTHAWCSNTSSLLNATYTAIGAGMENTTTADPMCTTGAIQQAADYTNNGRSDWYLPSKDELNELCKYAKNTGQAAGGATLCSGGADAAVRGFTATNYWSSSEDSNLNAWQHSFFDGSRGANLKGPPTANNVRVVRAFG
jgi:hypothetical protein